MKRASLIFISLVLVFLLALSCVASEVENGEITDTGAQNSSVNDELSQYIRETIMPIVIGVLTSISALIATLKSIMKTLSGLKDTKEQLKAEAELRKSDSEKTMAILAGGTEELKRRIEEIPDNREEIDELKREIGTLIDDVRLLSDIVSIGLSASAEAVRSGKGREIMARLGMIKARESAENEKT